MSEPVKIGIGGPVGAGKTQLVERLTRHMSREISMAAITNDIYTIEDAKILAANGILPDRPDHRRRNRRLPAHRHPRRHVHEYRRHRGTEAAAP